MKKTTKENRQTIIRELIETRTVSTHQDLQELLQRRGIIATQATVSRDLLDLGIIKERGTGRYRMQDRKVEDIGQAAEALAVFVKDIQQAQNLVIIKTKPGAAQNIAALIDTLAIEEIIGSVAGDDTVFIAGASVMAARRILNRLKRKF